MKRKRLAIIIFSFLAAVIVGTLLWPREREPEYNGFPLSTYLDRAHGSADRDLTQAIRHMGTNALPFLVRAAKYEQPRWRSWLYRTASNWPRVYNSRFGSWLLRDAPARRAGSSVIAFGILGADADPALDELRRIQRDSKDPVTSERARECIQFITERITIEPR